MIILTKIFISCISLCNGKLQWVNAIIAFILDKQRGKTIYNAVPNETVYITVCHILNHKPGGFKLNLSDLLFS